MLLVLLFTAVGLVTATLVCLPLLRGQRAPVERVQFDRAVYREQLREVEQDLARGVLNATEASSARLEIQRRLIATGTTSATRIWSARSPRLAVIVALLTLGSATALYLRFGAPALPDAPHGGTPATNVIATRSDHLDMRDAAARLETKLKADPSNAEGWLLYARTLSMLSDWQGAADAYRHAIELNQKAPDVFAGYGEMLVLSAGGIVSPAAHDAFAAALTRDPKNDIARYYLALGDSQAGEPKRAIDAWLALAADIPDESPMREAIGRGVADAAKAASLPVPALPKGVASLPGPTDAQMEAAAQMPDAERKQMISGMVAQLAEKLKEQPDNAEAWLRLGRSYAVLEDTDKSLDAYEHAARLRPDDAGIKLQMFETMIARLQANDPLPPPAMAILHQVAAAVPDQPEALWYLGVEAAREGRPNEARSDWMKLLTVLPSDGDDAKLVKSALDGLSAK